VANVKLFQDDITPGNKAAATRCTFEILGRHAVVPVEVKHLSDGVLVSRAGARQLMVVTLWLWANQLHSEHVIRSPVKQLVRKESGPAFGVADYTVVVVEADCTTVAEVFSARSCL
jgi:hypothetical protein